MLPLVPRLPAMAKALFVFPRCGGRCLVSLQLTFPAMASSHSSDLNLLLPTGLEAQAWFFPTSLSDPLAPLGSPGYELPRSQLPEGQRCRDLR